MSKAHSLRCLFFIFSDFEKQTDCYYIYQQVFNYSRQVFSCTRLSKNSQRISHKFPLAIHFYEYQLVDINRMQLWLNIKNAAKKCVFVKELKA